jgi:hypothetical protein
MIRRLRRLLGWDSNVASNSSGPVYIIPPTATPPSSAAPVRRAGGAKPGSKRPRTGPGRPGMQASGPRNETARSEKDRLAEMLAEGLTLDQDPLDVLNNPELSLDTSAESGFDPYNTGAFDRSSSWDKISKQRKR